MICVYGCKLIIIYYIDYVLHLPSSLSRLINSLYFLWFWYFEIFGAFSFFLLSWKFDGPNNRNKSWWHWHINFMEVWSNEGLKNLHLEYWVHLNKINNAQSKCAVYRQHRLSKFSVGGSSLDIAYFWSCSGGSWGWRNSHGK